MAIDPSLITASLETTVANTLTVVTPVAKQALSATTGTPTAVTAGTYNVR